MHSLLRDACECLCLCASAGCGCVLDEGEAFCHETSVGGTYRTLQSDGPGWVARVLEYDETVRFEIAMEHMLGREVDDLWKRVSAHGLPASPSSGSAQA